MGPITRISGYILLIDWIDFILLAQTKWRPEYTKKIVERIGSHVKDEKDK